MALRILPIPEASSLCELCFEKAEGIDDFLDALRSSVMVPSAVVMNGPPTNGASGEARGARRVLVAFEGHSAAVERQNRDLLQMAEKAVSAPSTGIVSLPLNTAGLALVQAWINNPVPTGA